MSFVSTLLFPVPRPSYNMHSFPGELIWIPRGLDYGSCKPGDCVPGIFLQCPNARYLVVYLHSNGEDVGLCYPFGCGLRLVLEVHVLLVEYPGYGLCPGQSSEETLWEAVDVAYRFVCEVLHWPKEDVIVMGRSLGAALATRLARTHVCHGLIVVAPFLSLVEAVGQYVGAGLARACVNDIFSNKEHMRGVDVPTMVIHGQQDRLVPCSHGRRLFDLCPHDRKVLVTPEDMGHNCDLLGNPDYLVRPILRFFSLPDYNFDDLDVPPQAFDKRLCLQYHNLMEMTKSDAPLKPLLGDQEPPACGQCDPLQGPQSQWEHFTGSSGDNDDQPELHSEETGALGSCQLPLPVDSLKHGSKADSHKPLRTAEASSFPLARPAEPLCWSLPPEDSAVADASGMDLPGIRAFEINHGISCYLHELSSFDAL